MVVAVARNAPWLPHALYSSTSASARGAARERPCHTLGAVRGPGKEASAGVAVVVVVVVVAVCCHSVWGGDYVCSRERVSVVAGERKRKERKGEKERENREREREKKKERKERREKEKGRK